VLVDGTELPSGVAYRDVQLAGQDQFIPILAEEPEFETFLRLLGSDGWALERGKRAIEANTFKYAESVTKLRQADQRRAAKERKLLEAAAAADSPDEGSPAATEPLEPAIPAPEPLTPAEEARGQRRRSRREAARAGRLAQAHGKQVWADPLGRKRRRCLAFALWGVRESRTMRHRFPLIAYSKVYGPGCPRDAAGGASC
jgi:hypothetical protein